MQEDAATPPAWLPVWHTLRHPVRWVLICTMMCCEQPALALRCADGPACSQLGRHGEADPSADDDAAQADPSWLLETPVSDTMTTEVTLTHPGALLTEAAALMTRHGVNRLPVLDHGRLVGIISRADVLAGVAGSAGAASDDAAGEPHREL